MTHFVKRFDWTATGGGKRGAIGQFGLLQNVVKVVLDGACGDTQVIGYTPVAEALGDKLRHLPLSARQRHQPRIGTDIAIVCRDTNDDQGVAEVTRRFQIDRQTGARRSTGCKVQQYASGHRVPRRPSKRLDHFANASQRSAVELRQMAGHFARQYKRSAGKERKVAAKRQQVVEALFKAMQAGPSGESAMMELFADDAVFIEPFSGQPQTHVGKAAIRDNFRDQWKNPPPDLTLTLDRVDLDDEQLRAEWHCTSPLFPSPMRGMTCSPSTPTARLCGSRSS